MIRESGRPRTPIVTFPFSGLAAAASGYAGRLNAKKIRETPHPLERPRPKCVNLGDTAYTPATA